MIIYFSGTGNSARIARMLGGMLNDDEQLELTGSLLIDPSSATVDCKSQRIVWVFPTYSWGVPPVVAAFIRHCMFSREARKAAHYMVTTCGDDMGYADRQWRRLLADRLITARSAHAVIMPNTYVLMKGFNVDPIEVSMQKLTESKHRLRHIADSIIADGEPLPIRGAFPWVKSALIYPWFIRHKMSPRPFHSTEGCISCGLCASDCPIDNITMRDGHPVWGDRCAMCLRCYHYCPRHAIAYGDKTIGKGQWQCPQKTIIIPDTNHE